MKHWANIPPPWLLLALAPRPAAALPVQAPFELEKWWLVAVLALVGALLCWRHLALRQSRQALQRQLDAEQLSLSACRHELRHATALHRAARDAERRRIGRDIHDDLGQHLLALQLDFAALGADPRFPTPLRAQLGQVEEHVHLTLRSLRSVIRDLRPTALHDGLRLAIQRQLDEFSRVSGIVCHLDAVEGCAPDGAAESALFRTLQETLSNVLRHAAATEVHVALGRDNGGFVLTVRDNGVGLAPGCECRGHGLSGIADRIDAAGGRVTLDSEPGKGTTVRIALPGVAPCKQPEFCD